MSFVAATDAPGCDLHLDAAQGNTTSITYYGQITRILQRHCLECHRDGGIGPFPLETLEDVVSHAGMIETVVRNKTMPPWFADYPSSSDAQQSIEHKLIWSNDRSLATDDREALLAAAREMIGPFMCRPEDIANTILFLCSDESRHINGAAIVVDNTATISHPY